MKPLNMIAGGLLGATVLLGAASCSDDHYDIRSAEASAANTIWQNIEANEQLDSLGMILKRLKVYRKDTESYDANKQTYSDLLNQSQTFTLWAPINGTYNAKSYLNEIDSISKLVAEGKGAEAVKREYTLGQQFIQNHLARFNYESNKSEQEVRLMNSKICYYNASTGIFNNVPLNAKYANVPSSNGTMHVLDGSSQFAYNVYDYMKAYSNIFSNVYNTIAASDTTIFSEGQSIAGSMNENGSVVYVDSVFITQNDLLSASNADIKDEDSLYIAIIPTDQAWDQAMSKVGALFKYARTYKTNYSKESASVFSTDYKLNADSLKNYNTNEALISSMFFSPGYFDEDISRSDSAALINYMLTADSVAATNHLYLYNPNPGGTNPMLAGITPVKASNGYIFPLEDYTIDPTYFYQQKLEIDLTYDNNIGYNTNAMVSGGTLCTLEAGETGNWNEGVVGEVEDDNYRFFQCNGQQKLYIPLRNVLSGSYRVKMQILPNRINTAYVLYDENGDELIDREHNVFRCSIHGDNYNSETFAKNTTITVNQDSIQTVTLFDKVTFSKSYYNLPTDLESFPVLVIEYTRAMLNNMTYSDMPVGLSAKKVILEPIHEGE